MSTEEDTFFSDLTNDAGVSAIVGTRVYPNKLPDDVTFPAIAYRTVSAVRIGGLCLQRRIQADLYAKNYSNSSDSLKSLRDAVKALADRKSNWVYVEGPDLWEEDTRLHHQPLDIMVS